MIQVDNLTKRYGLVEAIHDVSFSVDKGRIVGFLGPNGAGKSTTMKILSCFMPASGGTATVAGFDVFSQSLEVRRRIGYLPENAPLYPDLSVASYLDFVAEIKGVGRAARRGRVADVMERCFITDMQNRLIGKLSKGYRQRVGLAQALLGDPEVLILDEPTIGLDPRQIAEIRALIRSLAGQHTVILSTHILPEVSMVCDGVIIINRGRIVAQGTESDLVRQAFPSARIEVRVAGATGDVAGALRAVPGVVGIEPLASRDGAVGFLVEAERDRDVRPDLVRLVTGKGWALQELHQVGMSLEEVFIRVVAGEQDSVEVIATEEAR
ncbi:MAG TPA: ATP-binding cassette domain-containing protein [Methylomirabilota bacterium]|jgi:ABC-2 type transport system ATP-binding protein|nr:ATP-binding cassette domain-containing protein [Methylomirabilota bacterium]